jgi:hypothetical protein
MGALTIAFDTTMVGALALPWVLLVIHLFFFEGESRLEGAVNRVKDLGQPAVAGVLLFAVTYTLGSIVSRTAQDIFDDDDLHIMLPVSGRLFRVGVTEGRILTGVYCDGSKNKLLLAGKENPVLEKTVKAFQNFPDREALCEQTLSWSVAPKTNWQDDKLNQTAEDMVGLQETALMVKGGDYTLRLRQLHDQIMVLRGAAFNGFIGFSLCLFACGAKLKSSQEKRSRWQNWVLVPVPAIYLVVALIATFHHFGGREPSSDAPYMEFTLLLLALAGAWLIWKPASWLGQVGAKQAAGGAAVNLAAANPAPTGVTPKNVTPGNPAAQCEWRIEHWMRLAALSAVLTTAAFLGWWSTETLYGEQVIYSYDSQVYQNQASQNSGTTATQP